VPSRPPVILLREIVTTIDEHGLKQCHLKKHARAVAQFFDLLAAQHLRSDVATALQARLVKNRDKLFTFLQYDGVPWNNTMAENAIKRFASYRENAGAMMTEKGLSDYLLLLSLCHTCRYRGVSFLRFLLSRQRDMEAFCRRRGSRRRSPLVEVYPKGFVPPHLARLRQKAAHRLAEPHHAADLDLFHFPALS
jgi:hypothetical protein